MANSCPQMAGLGPALRRADLLIDVVLTSVAGVGVLGVCDGSGVGCECGVMRDHLHDA